LVTNLRTGEPAVPRIPGVRDLDASADGRIEFANWLTNPENAMFPRAIVNRLWSAMFGRGLVEPVDDLRNTNPATHPQLLAKLADDFVEHGYDLRHTLRLIAFSETYARGDGRELTGGAAERALADDRFYARSYVRPLAAEVLADAIADITGVADQYGNEPLGTRAVALFNPATPAESLDVLGRCSRTEPCEGNPVGGGLPAMLHQINGPLVNRKIAAEAGVLHKLLASGQATEKIVADFYLRALTRPPTEAEHTFWKQQLSAAEEQDRTARLEDFVWSLLTSREFMTNH
jgi:hypothetical protein